MAHPFYNRKSWKLLRERQLAEHPLCLKCLERGVITEGTTVDHVIPHRGVWSVFADPKNLQTLCDHHHNSEKQSEEVRGFSLAVGKDGWPVDPRHPVNR